MTAEAESRRTDSNCRPMLYESIALPTELRRPVSKGEMIAKSVFAARHPNGRIWLFLKTGFQAAACSRFLAWLLDTLFRNLVRNSFGQLGWNQFFDRFSLGLKQRL